MMEVVSRRWQSGKKAKRRRARQRRNEGKGKREGEEQRWNQSGDRAGLGRMEEET